MTNDKTVTMSRELAQRIFDWCDGSYGGRIINEMEELRAVLAQEAGPVVERQEPLAWVVEDRSSGLLADGHKGLDWFAGKLINIPIGTKLYMGHEVNISAKPPEPLPITEGMERLMEAYRLGEFRLEGGSPTVEAMSCASYDNSETAMRDHDFDSYAAGYQAAIYEEVSSLLGHIACLDKVKELNQ